MPNKSSFPPVEIPRHTLYQEIFETLEGDELKLPAITDTHTGQTVSYGELRGMVDAFAGHLSHIGIRPGDVVALHCPNSIAFAVAFHGIMRAGAAASTVGVLYNEKDIHRQLEDCGARALVSVHALGDHAGHAARALGLDEESIMLLDDGERGLEAILGAGRTAPEVDLDPAEALAALPYSSGTTGFPKGVRLTHRNLVANVRQTLPMLAANGKRRDSVNVTPLPFFHIYGMTVMLNASLRSRNHLVTMPSFDLKDFLRVLQDHEADWGFVAPPILVALAKHPVVDEFDLSHLNVLISGAAPLDAKLAHAVEERIGVRVIQGYGLTETSPVTHVTVIDECDVSSIGKAVPCTEFKIVDIDDPEHPEIPLPDPGSEHSPRGELWIRGPQVMAGYLNNEEATAETIDPEGWLRTGDVVEADHEGNLYVVDRAKELIKYKGYQVAPAELEALLLTHEDIADAAVVGHIRPDDGEEIPHAFVVPAQGAEIDPDAIITWVAEQVTPYKKVRKVDVIDEVPKSASGKILRRELKQHQPLD